MADTVYTFDEFWNFITNQFMSTVMSAVGGNKFFVALHGDKDDVTTKNYYFNAGSFLIPASSDTRACIYREADESKQGGYKYTIIGGSATAGYSGIDSNFASTIIGQGGIVQDLVEWLSNIKRYQDEGTYLVLKYGTLIGYTRFNLSYKYEGSTYYYREQEVGASTFDVTDNYDFKIYSNCIYASKEDALEYIRTGDESKRILSDTAVNYTLYLDYVERTSQFIQSNLKITWNSDIEETWIAEEKVDVYCTYYDTDFPIETLVQSAINLGAFLETDFTSGSISFSYDNAWDFIKEKLILVSLVKGSIVFVFSTSILGEKRVAYCVLNYKGTENTDLVELSDVATDDTTFATVLGSAGDDDDGYSDDDEDDDDKDSSGDEGFSTSYTLITSYAMTQARLETLGDFIWEDDLFENIKLWNNSPIENIVSLKAFPFSLSGTDTEVVLGNVNSGVNGAKLDKSTYSIELGSHKVTKKYNSFLDYAPYTKVTIHLPYIGFCELDTNIVMGHTITVTYLVDLITGACKALITMTRDDNKKQVYYEYNGQMGIDVPLSASNRAQVESSYISAGIGLAVSAATLGASVGAMGGAGMTEGISNMMVTNQIGASARASTASVLDSAKSVYHYESTSAGSPNVTSASNANRSCYILIDRPTIDMPDTFNHTHGRMCNLSLTIGGKDCKGYTVCDSHIDLSDMYGTIAEKNELISILSTGFFV